MSGAAPTFWPLADGTPVACREKLHVLAENESELRAMLQDVFDDAVLMGVDEAWMRQRLLDAVAALSSPRRRTGSA